MKDLKFQPGWMMRFPSCTALGTAQRITGGTTWRPLVAEGLGAGGWNYRELLRAVSGSCFTMDVDQIWMPRVFPRLITTY